MIIFSSSLRTYSLRVWELEKKQKFLTIAGTHPLFLGIYKYGGQHKNRPYFYKKEQYTDYTHQTVENKFFLVFAENGNEIWVQVKFIKNVVLICF